MKETGKERFILTKTYEVAYALFRLAAPMHEKDLSERLRASGASLLEAVAAGDYISAGSIIQVMECMVKFAGDVNVIGTANADVTLREIYALDAAIAERRTIPKTDDVDVAEIFSQVDIPAKPQVVEPIRQEPVVRQSEQMYSSPEEIVEHEAASHIVSQTEEPSTNINGILKSAIRQTAILEKIRQSGNCRLKDIQEILPDASERTIRYDLQTLLEQNLIERIGNVGPSVFYRATQSAQG